MLPVYQFWGSTIWTKWQNERITEATIRFLLQNRKTSNPIKPVLCHLICANVRTYTTRTHTHNLMQTNTFSVHIIWWYTSWHFSVYDRSRVRSNSQTNRAGLINYSKMNLFINNLFMSLSYYDPTRKSNWAACCAWHLHGRDIEMDGTSAGESKRKTEIDRATGRTK